MVEDLRDAANPRTMPLIVVPTPLGNLGDVTPRALQALRECDLLVAEDSRVARTLLAALKLPGREIWSYHDHNAAATAPKILERARHERVVLTTDAGTPGISDPGSELIAAAHAAGVAVDLLPGPSALVGAAVLSGFSLRRFVFEGFAARTSRARREQFARALALGATSVWFESPKRIRATLADLAAVAPGARIFLLREYTKLHEQHLLGSPADVAAQLSEPVRGEIAFVIEAAAAVRATPDAASLEAAIDALLARDVPVPAIAKELAERGYGARRSLYARATERKRHRKGLW